MDFAVLAPSGKHLAKGEVAVVDVQTGIAINLTNTPGINEGSPDWSTGGKPSGAAAIGDPVAGSGETGAAISANPVRVWTTPSGRGTAVNYALPRSGHVRLRLFDVRGREIACLVNGPQAAGAHAVSFSGRRVGSQVYVYRLEWDGGTSSGKLVMVR